ncbi:MAG: Phosphoglycerol transferase I [Planctomycetes bacterium]|nr:Phosphoglycerol transferase I [Planctomycetota bacterium]
MPDSTAGHAPRSGGHFGGRLGGRIDALVTRSRLGPLLVGAACYAGASTALRLALLGAFWREAEVSLPGAAAVVGLGLGFDLVAAVYLTLPCAAAAALLPSRAWRSRWIRGGAIAACAAWAYVTLFGGVIEWFFFDEFGSRFNFVAVDYLVYSKEVVGNIRESYPLQWILPAVAVPAAAVFALVRLPLARAMGGDAPPGRRFRDVAAHAALAAALGWTVSDSAADVAGNRFAAQIARNGVHSFFAALRNSRLPWDENYVTLPEGRAAAILRERLGAPPGGVGVTRRVRGEGGEIRPNVVIVCVESLSAWFMDEFRAQHRESGPSCTPRLDGLAKRSLLFTRLYATGTRTVRGLEALTLSIPPTPGCAVPKRADCAGFYATGPLFRARGYVTKFLYGGYGYFDNMNEFFSGNGFDVVDRSDLESSEVSFSNVWGVCDEDLFRRTLRECDRTAAAGDRFFHFVMTTSNHLPFTYPDGRIDVPSGTGRDGAVRYTDHAIGAFLDEAAKRPWFDDTVFVVVADHCSSSRGKSELPVDRFHIPALIFAPKLVPPGRCDELCSQIDLVPTLLGILNWDYESRFFGADVLRRPPRRALLCNYLNVGLYDGERLLTLGLHRDAQMDRISQGGRKVVREAAPDPAMVEEAAAWFGGAAEFLESGAQRQTDVAGLLPAPR